MTKRFAEDDVQETFLSPAVKRFKPEPESTHQSLDVDRSLLLLPSHFCDIMKKSRDRSALLALINCLERCAKIAEFLDSAKDDAYWNLPVICRFESSRLFLKMAFETDLEATPLLIDTCRPRLNDPYSGSGPAYVTHLSKSKHRQLFEYSEMHLNRLGQAFSKLALPFSSMGPHITLYHSSNEFILRLCPVALAINRDWPRLAQRIMLDPQCLLETNDKSESFNKWFF